MKRVAFAVFIILLFSSCACIALYPDRADAWDKSIDTKEECYTTRIWHMVEDDGSVTLVTTIYSYDDTGAEVFNFKDGVYICFNGQLKRFSSSFFLKQMKEKK